MNKDNIKISSNYSSIINYPINYLNFTLAKNKTIQKQMKLNSNIAIL